jgi:hypothetical protein
MSFRLFPGVLAAALLALAASCPPGRPSPSSNYNTGNRLVFPIVATGPGTIDGLANEAAWTNGFRFVMEDGGSFPAAELRGVADAGHIYIHVAVEDDGFEESDVLVVGLNPDNTSGNYRRIHAFPCKPTGSCPATTSGAITTVDYATGSLAGTTYTWTAQPLGSIVAGRATTTAPKKWQVELKIPRGAPFNFVDTNFFGLFVDVARTSPSTGIAGEAVQYTWPPAEFIGSTNENDILAELETGTLGPTDWGNATLHTGFGNGVSIDGGDIRTNHPSDPSLIRLNGSNIFYADVFNNSSSGGTLVDAKAVRATFKIANFGLPDLGTWTNVPGAGNPTAAADIDPAVARTYATGGWTLSASEVTNYTAEPHQCIKVDLTSTDGSTVFVNTSAQRNMDFTTSGSPFQERATLTAQRFEPPGGGRTLSYTLREVFVNFDPRLTWTTEIRGANRIADGIYKAEMGPEARHALEISVEPPRVQIPSSTVRIPPGTGGSARPPVSVEVRADEVVTLIGSGTIDLGGQSVTSAGTPVQDRSPKGRGPRRLGAVLGSFDEFRESSFVVGNAATIKVPAGARALQLKIEDEPQGYERQRGEGYEIQVVRTAIEPWMLANNPDLGRVVKGNDVFVAVGANLPTWMLRGERDTGRYIRIGGRSFRVYQPLGTFGYIVKTIR